MSQLGGARGSPRHPQWLEAGATGSFRSRKHTAGEGVNSTCFSKQPDPPYSSREPAALLGQAAWTLRPSRTPLRTHVSPGNLEAAAQCRMHLRLATWPADTEDRRRKPSVRGLEASVCLFSVSLVSIVGAAPAAQCAFPARGLDSPGSPPGSVPTVTFLLLYFNFASEREQ